MSRQRTAKRRAEERRRQRTTWIWRMVLGKNTGIRVGWIANKTRGDPEDVIAVDIKSVSDRIRFEMRIDEAAGLAAGICKVLCVQATRGRIARNEFLLGQQLYRLGSKKRARQVVARAIAGLGAR